MPTTPNKNEKKEVDLYTIWAEQCILWSKTRVETVMFFQPLYINPNEPFSSGMRSYRCFKQNYLPFGVGVSPVRCAQNDAAKLVEHTRSVFFCFLRGDFLSIAKWVCHPQNLFRAVFRQGPKPSIVQRKKSIFSFFNLYESPFFFMNSKIGKSSSLIFKTMCFTSLAWL